MKVAWVSVSGTTTANTTPVIDTTSPISVPENSTSVVTLSATDPDPGATASWSLVGGEDQSHFSLSGDVLSFSSAKDFENHSDTGSDNTYKVRVQVEDNLGATATKDLVVNVTDEDEPPSAPGSLSVSSSTQNSLTVTWTAPNMNGKPALTGYSVQQRTPPSTGSWVDVTHSGTGTSVTISSLVTNTNYEVQVKAINDEGESAWVSTSGTTQDNTGPTIDTTSPISVPENSTSVVTLSATDPDPGATQSWTLVGGEDQSHFSLSGAVLSFSSAKDFENHSDTGSDNTYKVRVQVEDDRNATATKELVVNVTDVDEPPSVPTGLSVSQVTGSSLTVTWVAPIASSDRPPVTGYDVQYRTPLNTGTWEDATHSGTGTSVTISGLKGSTGYDIQVRSVSDEGESDWVAVVGTTEGASPPTILSPGPFNVSENQVYVTELKARATLGQALSWSLAGGEDQSLFLLTKSGKLSFSAPQNFEDPDDDDQIKSIS